MRAQQGGNAGAGVGRRVVALSEAARHATVTVVVAPEPPARAANDFMFLATTQTAVLRCKTRRHWPCRWRSDTAPDVAAASRGFETM